MLSLRYMKVLLVLWFLKSKAKRNNLCIIRKVGVKFSPIFRLHHYDQMCSRHLFCLCLWLCKIVFWKKINMSPLFSLGFFQPLCAADAHPLSVVTGLFQPYLIYWTLGFVLFFRRGIICRRIISTFSCSRDQFIKCDAYWITVLSFIIKL